MGTTSFATKHVLQAHDTVRPQSMSTDGLLAALPAAVICLDWADKVVFANPAAEELFGLSAAYLSAGLAQAVPADSQLLAIARRTRALAQPVREHDVPVDLIRRGVTVALDVDAAPLPAEKGGAWGGLVLAMRERALVQRFDRQAQQREAARSVAALAGMLAHEVRNPLAGIRGAAQLLEEGASEADRELAHMIRDEVDRVARLIARMEAFGEANASPHVPVNIHEVLDRVRALAQHGAGKPTQISRHYDPSLPLVLGNRDELVQLFLNLVKNAIEALPSGHGEVALGTSYAPGLMVAGPDGRRRHRAPICVSVRDNGAGIPEAIREHLFDPYVSTKPSGTGLGLAMVAKLVRDHGGAIEFESRPRRTEFRVYLPAAEREMLP
ncbi:MAG: PAS domain-containing protein [Alphaproteobacteria bacterium]|nr:PAS domain-containing protein [Alphaproteobacteria bacterium]